MTDPFLAMHRISELRYSISGTLSPIGIRDQMVRAKLFVDRAIEQKLIGPDRQLLVVGAGAAGVTAAYYAAAEKNIRVTLIDKRDQPFHLQRQCQTRWIDPTLYDWPAAHWDVRNYPWLRPLDPAETIPIPWFAGMANILVGHWRNFHDKARTDAAISGNYRFLPGMKYIEKDSPVVGNAIKVKYRPVTPEELVPGLHPSEYWALEAKLDQEVRDGTRGFLEEPFGAVLDARGFRPERLQILPDGKDGATVDRKEFFRSLAFWQTDTFADPNLGLSSQQKKWRVLICGDGDGALQDFLRIATGLPSPGHFMKELELKKVLAPGDLRRLYSAEDQGHRSKIWNNRNHDHSVQLRLDDFHKELISKLLPTPSGKKIKSIVRRALKFSKNIDLRLVHPCRHFTAAYPLNRFLVHLVSAVVESAPVGRRPSISIEHGASVLSVKCDGHKPGNPVDCLGKEHMVTTAQWPDCTKEVLKGTVGPATGMYDVVILRLGLENSDPDRLVHQFSRHLLPYHPDC